MEAGRDEAVYQLTSPVEDIFVFLDRVLDKELGFVGTESRLKLVIDTPADLVVDSSDEPQTRLEHLQSEERQIQQEIQQIETEGRVSKYRPSQIREQFAGAVLLLRHFSLDARAACAIPAGLLRCVGSTHVYIYSKLTEKQTRFRCGLEHSSTRSSLTKYYVYRSFD